MHCKSPWIKASGGRMNENEFQIKNLMHKNLLLRTASAVLLCVSFPPSAPCSPHGQSDTRGRGAVSSDHCCSDPGHTTTGIRQNCFLELTQANCLCICPFVWVYKNLMYNILKFVTVKSAGRLLSFSISLGMPVLSHRTRKFSLRGQNITCHDKILLLIVLVTRQTHLAERSIFKGCLESWAKKWKISVFSPVVHIKSGFKCSWPFSSLWPLK